MKRPAGMLAFLGLLPIVLLLVTCATFSQRIQKIKRHGMDAAQIPNWSAEDLEFFLYGSMSSEFVPERVMNAFIATYPDLFPGGNLSAYGTIYEEGKAWPIGFSRRNISYFGGVDSIGINCAVCHAGQTQFPGDVKPRLVLGQASHFDVYGFFGAVTVAMLYTAKPENMEKFLQHYLQNPSAHEKFTEAVSKQRSTIRKSITNNPMGSKGVPPGTLHEFAPRSFEWPREDLENGMDLVPLVENFLKLFHNMRTALHIPEKLPPPLKSLPGPGRTDAFGVLAAAFFRFPTRFDAPTKYGITWNLEERTWVHWDGNTQDPMARNLAASLGLGTPMVDHGKWVVYADMKRMTDLDESLRAPRFPGPIDQVKARAGATLYQNHCARCHDVRTEEERLFSLKEVGTDPNRARFFDQKQADLLNSWIASLRVKGYSPIKDGIRSTGKYWASTMAGVWARSPYLHNGSVRTMWELLTPPRKRTKSFKRGSRLYDSQDLGYENAGPFNFDTSISGNSNSGHDHATDLSHTDKRHLIEYLKTL